MSEPILLNVIGRPAPQGSKTAVVRGGRAVVIEGKGATGRAAVKEWRRAVADAARGHLTRQGATVIDGPCLVDVEFTLARPASVSVKKRPYPSVKPDVDKLARSTLDALCDGGLVAADQLVIDLHIRKRYAVAGEPPGARIVIRRVGADA